MKPTCSAPLSASQRQHIGERLLEERTRTLRALNRARDVAADPGEVTGNRYADDPADAAIDTIEGTLRGVLASRETMALAEIDRALRRLYREPDRFGLDELTGEPIAFARLDIIPWARRAA